MRRRNLCLSPIIPLLALLLSTPPSSIADDPEDNPIARFQQYLRINTAHPNPNYAPAVAFLQSQAQSIGIQTQILEFVPSKPVVLLTWPGSLPSLPSVMFNSHLDSVPAEPQKWLHPPFSAVRSSDGKIYARGAQDDKCIAVQYLEAIRNLRLRNFQPTRTIHVSYVPDEETGGADGAALFAQSEQFRELNIGFFMDEGQASTNDEFRVFYADRTPWNLVIKATGSPGHGARMYDKTAMENLMKSIEGITKFRDAQFDVVKRGWAADSEVISVNPVYLKAGIPSPTGFVMNMQPSEAEAGFNIRLPPSADSDHLKKTIAEEWAPASRNLTFHISESGPLRDYKGHPLMTSTNETNPWWSVFEQAIAAAGGKLAKPEILASTTDARFIRQLGIPVLGFSPMINTPILLHDHNEFLEETIFLKGIKVYESIISSFSSFTVTHKLSNKNKFCTHQQLHSFTDNSNRDLLERPQDNTIAGTRREFKSRPTGAELQENKERRTHRTEDADGRWRKEDAPHQDVENRNRKRRRTTATKDGDGRWREEDAPHQDLENRNRKRQRTTGRRRLKTATEDGGRRTHCTRIWRTATGRRWTTTATGVTEAEDGAWRGSKLGPARWRGRERK
ncbi:hypothetical protein V2J09_000791 [Rumex salicifolius]